MKQNRYSNFAQLSEKETEGVDYAIRSRNGNSPIAVIAIHGGRIEPSTLEIADAIAGNDHLFYGFEGKKIHNNACLHIKSTRFDEPLCIEIVSKAAVTISIHGCVGEGEQVYLGGLNETLRSLIAETLAENDFTVNSNMKKGMLGVHQQNICNRFSPGVQFEITRNLRDRLISSFKLKSGQRQQKTWNRFIRAVRHPLNKYLSLLNGTTVD